ncbi:GNAT family N-acetyltransferase [Gilliamella sp. WF3-4]|jgi:ribosomal protein S18 acetylase RimI-like enzyme|uniref:GNAT family N-acetyltransferase n=1 Tax=Gilliamella sp. WF3-4 TaxID=3120255 RepID=UPI00080E5B1F|nr:GNAT family N-acetyltransferase [Gilliamella apicola]OCG16944.1 hypothetical protein A9G47_09830 [Gilliamella apicola]
MENSECIIRKIEKQDLKNLIKLCSKHADYEALFFDEDPELIKRWEQLFFSANSKIYCWVCVNQKNHIIGYMSVTIDYSTWSALPFLYLDCLYLQEEYRKKGLGKRLIATLENFAFEKNINSIEWQTPPDNIIGINFYQAIGAKALDKKRFKLIVPKVK